MYHYIRKSSTKFPDLKGFSESDFISQVNFIKKKFETPNISELINWLLDGYTPKRPMCMLSFDDGLKEHGNFVTEILSNNKMEGLFYITTGCITDKKVLSVHKNHFLMAQLPFKTYKHEFFKIADSLGIKIPICDINVVKKTYRWDGLEVAKFKYLINYQLDKSISTKLLKIIFENHFGNEADFAQDLYLQWNDIVKMQQEGMQIGGHTHNHQVLSELSVAEQRNEIVKNKNLIETNCSNQEYWTFAYPFGKENTFDSQTIGILKEVGYSVAFSSTVGKVFKHDDFFTLKRIDPKDLL